MSGASLYVIHQTLEELQQLRQQITEDENIADEARAVGLQETDKAIAEWIDRSPEKVSSYIGVLLAIKDEQRGARREIARQTAILRAAEATEERIKANTLAAMQRFGITQLNATPSSGLRRQGNGGKQTLEINLSLIPEDFEIVTVRMPSLAWTVVSGEANRALRPNETITETIEANTEAIREALKQRVVCPECKGSGERADEQTGSADDDCFRCEGVGTIAATVPGAKLLPLGEHVRIFPKSPKEIEP